MSKPTGKNKLYKTIAKPAFVGAIAAVASGVGFNGMADVVTPLGNMPLLIPVAVGVGVASYITEISKNYLVSGSGYMTLAIANPLITGAASIATMYIATSGNVGYSNALPLFLLGAGSELAGDYTYTYFVSPYVS